jgi:ribonuclease P protein component
MLKKANRADKKTVEKIFQKGKFINSQLFTFKFLILPATFKKISVLAPKNVAKLAVQRNLLRRRGYVALKKYLSSFPAGVAGVLIFKKYQDDIFLIENEIKTILSKIN